VVRGWLGSKRGLDSKIILSAILIILSEDTLPAQIRENLTGAAEWAAEKREKR